MRRFILGWEYSVAEDKFLVRFYSEEDWYKKPVEYRSSHWRGCDEFYARDELEAFMYALKIEEHLNDR